MAKKIELSVAIRNKALNRAWRDSSDDGVAIRIHDGTTDIPIVQFNEAGGGVIRLKNPVQFAIAKGTTIDFISLYKASDISPSGLLANINLEGDEIEYFEDNGIYTIGEISISLVNKE